MPSAQDCANLLLETIPNLMRSIGGSIRQKRVEDDEPLTMGQYRLMQMLGHQQRTLGELATIHQVTPSTMSRSIDLLVRRDWVARRDNPSDRRQVLLSLTDEGRLIHAAIVQHMHSGVAQLLDQLDDEERERLYDGLTVLRTLLARTAGPEGCKDAERDLADPTHRDHLYSKGEL